jgi:hypothetical protein
VTVPSLKRTKDDDTLEDALLAEVQRSRQILLTASEPRMELARLHLRNALEMFSDLVLNGRGGK